MKQLLKRWYLCLGILPASFVASAIYCAATYWVGPTWDPLTDSGHIFYRDPRAFLGAFILLIGAAKTGFIIYVFHERTLRWESCQ